MKKKLLAGSIFLVLAVACFSCSDNKCRRCSVAASNAVKVTQLVK